MYATISKRTVPVCFLSRSKARRFAYANAKRDASLTQVAKRGRFAYLKAKQGRFAYWTSMSTYSFQHLAETAEIVQKLMVFSVGGGNVEKNVSPNLISALQYAKEDACCVVRPLTLKLSLRTRKHFKQSSGTYLSEAQPDRETLQRSI